MSERWVTAEVLALDLGSNLGWAMHSKRGLESGVLSLKDKGKFSLNGFNRLYVWLVGHKVRFLNNGGDEKLFTILVEVPHCGKFMAANRILFGLLAVVNMFGSVCGIKVVEYRPKAIKKFWTGNGNANKAQMLVASRKKGMLIKDHNENDAIAMLHLYLEGPK